MKFPVAFLAVLALASPLSAFKLPASGSGALAKELQDMVDLVPLDKIISIIKAYAAQDKEVQVALKVLQSNELKLLVSDVETNPEVKNLVKYMQNAGLDIISLINKVNDVLGLGHISSLEASEYKISGGLDGLGRDINSVIPSQEINHLFWEKMKTSHVFRDFLSEIARTNLPHFTLNTHYVKLVQEAEQAKIGAEDFREQLPILVVSKTILALQKP